MEKITIGIIGGGRIGRMHAGTIYTGMQDVTIKYVSDIYPQAAQQWGPMYGVQNVVSDAEIVFNDPEVQAVLFCTSTDTHADYIIRSQGKRSIQIDIQANHRKNSNHCGYRLLC